MTTDEFVELCRCGETTKVQYKECFTTQTKIAQEMVAFANTHGGVMLFGVQDKTGKMLGLTYQQLQDTGLELGNTANEQVKPAIYIETETVKVDFECTGGQFKAIVWRIDKDAEGLVINDSGLVVNVPKLVVNDTKLVLNEEDLTVKLVVNGKKLTVKVGSNDEKLVVKLKRLTERAEKLTVNLTVNRLEILKMMLENPTITTIEMAQAIGISSTSVKNNIEVMRDKLIRRVGSDKSGIWDVILE